MFETEKNAIFRLEVILSLLTQELLSFAFTVGNYPGNAVFGVRTFYVLPRAEHWARWTLHDTLHNFSKKGPITYMLIT